MNPFGFTIPLFLVLPVLTAVIGVGVTYGIMKTRQEGIGKDLSEMKKSIRDMDKRIDMLDKESHLTPEGCEKNQARCQAMLLMSIKNIEEVVRSIHDKMNAIDQKISDFSGRLVRVETQVLALEREVRNGKRSNQ